MTASLRTRERIGFRGGRRTNRQPAQLERVAFRTPRFLDFVGQRELTGQIGHPVEAWPLVILKELVDNVLDASEETEVTPSITITVDTFMGTIVISDNGPGIAAATIADIVDYDVRVSSREAYVAPTRGAQGNALKTILAIGGPPTRPRRIGTIPRGLNAILPRI